jgi:hypothetical protein
MGGAGCGGRNQRLKVRAASDGTDSPKNPAKSRVFESLRRLRCVRRANSILIETEFVVEGMGR